MLADRGVSVDHTTMDRWVQRFAPELERRLRRHLRPCRGPWHVDATYASNRRLAVAGGVTLADMVRRCDSELAMKLPASR